MKQEQTIDDILKLLKDSINDEATSTEKPSDSVETHEPMSEDVLKERLQKQYGEQAAETSEAQDSYTLDDDFLQEAVVETDGEEEIESTEEELEEIEEPEEIEEIEEIEKEEEIEVQKEVTESVEEEMPLAIDYDDVEEEIEYELLPRVGEEVPTGVILRDQPTDAVPVGQRWTLVSEEENDSNLLQEKESDPLLSGVTYTTPALAESFGSFEKSEEDSAYDLMRQFGCEEEWKSDDLPLSAAEEESSFEEEEDIFAVYQKKKRYAILRMCGCALISVLLFFYETLPLLGVEFGGILNYHDYVGAYLLMGFQLLFISSLLFGKRMGEGVFRIFSLRPNLYSVTALSVIGVLIYDLVATLTMHEWVAPFHCSVSLLILVLSWSEYLLLSREIKILSVLSSDPERSQYTLDELSSDDRYVAKMMRGGLSENTKVSVPECCMDSNEFFKETTQPSLDLRMASILLLPSLLLSIITAIVTVLLNWSLSITMLTAISMLLVTLPVSAAAVISFPLWFSANRLAKRQIVISGCEPMDEMSETDVLIFEDMHLFRKCTTADTGIAFYEKQQTAKVLGCLECLYSRLGGPLSDAFANVPEQYRFKTLSIRRLTNGGVEALIERKHTFLVGDAVFMKRYGLNFPNSEEKAGRTTVYISLDGKISAKMSVRYQPEPIFEMLVERMYQEGTQCVIKTFDPMISAARISSLRTMGNSPISVIHQNLSDLSDASKPKKQKITATGMLAVASRFKLIEALSWSRALVRIRHLHQGMIATMSILGLVVIGVLIGFEKMQMVNQYWLILWGALSTLIAIWITAATVPSKKYFSVEAYREEWEKKQARNNKKQKGNK